MGTKKVGAFPSPPRKATIIIFHPEAKSSIFLNFNFMNISSLQKIFLILR